MEQGLKIVRGTVTPECNQGALAGLGQSNLHSPGSLACSSFLWILCCLKVPCVAEFLAYSFLAHKMSQPHFHLSFVNGTHSPPIPSSSLPLPPVAPLNLSLCSFIFSFSITLSFSFSFPPLVSLLLPLYSLPSTSPDACTHTDFEPCSPQSPLSSAPLPGRWAGIQTICGARNKQEPGGYGVAAW